MSEVSQELLEIADRLDRIADRYTMPEIKQPLDKLDEAARDIGKAWSGSWLGYHASVYYEDLQTPPPTAQFSQEWGLKSLFSSGLGSRGAWKNFDEEFVTSEIYDRAGNPNMKTALEFGEELASKFEKYHMDVLSRLELEISGVQDNFLTHLKSKIEELSILSKSEVVNRLRPQGQTMTRDTLAIGQGYRTPPHLSVLSDILEIQYSVKMVKRLSNFSRQFGSHVERQSNRRLSVGRIGTNVFIGHGRSLIWRELSEFMQNSLRLPVDEFNSVPVAGITNIQRLSEMLDAAAIAFLVMTGEDEQSDGQLHARMNVVHEAGLFQGRLGFARAIVVLEEGCEAFSNIDGLGQIRFPKGNIKAIFEDIRQVLEREDLIQHHS